MRILTNNPLEREMTRLPRAFPMRFARPALPSRECDGICCYYHPVRCRSYCLKQLAEGLYRKPQEA